MNCPYCGGALQPDPNNPGKVLCYNCRKRFDTGSGVNAQTQPPNQRPQYYQQPQQPQQSQQPQQPQRPQQYQQSPQYQQSQQYNQQNAQYPPRYSQAVQYGDNAGVNGPQVAKKKRSSAKAVIALLLGIITVFLMFVPVANACSLVTGIAALILVASTFRGIAAGMLSGKVTTIVAAVASIIGMLGSVATTILFILGITLPFTYVPPIIDDLFGGNSDSVSNVTNTSTDTDTEANNIINDNSTTSSEQATGTMYWPGLPIYVDDTEIILLQTTVQDLVDAGFEMKPNDGQAGSVLDLDQYIQADTSYDLIVKNPNDTCNDRIYFEVKNLSETDIKLADALVSLVQYDSTYDSERNNYTIRFSNMTMDVTDITEAKDILGEATKTYERSIEYQNFDGYNLIVNFDDDKVGDIYYSWDYSGNGELDGSFYIENTHFVLGKSTIEDFNDIGYYIVDDDTLQDTDRYSAQIASNDEVKDIILRNQNQGIGYIEVTVKNNTNEPLDVSKCTITEISCSALGWSWLFSYHSIFNGRELNVDVLEKILGMKVNKWSASEDNQLLWKRFTDEANGYQVEFRTLDIYDESWTDIDSMTLKIIDSTN